MAAPPKGQMTDKLVGGFFAKARNATRRRYVASAGNVGRLMRLFHGTIDALAAAREAKGDAFEAVDEAVGWPKLLRIRLCYKKVPFVRWGPNGV